MTEAPRRAAGSPPASQVLSGFQLQIHPGRPGWRVRNLHLTRGDLIRLAIAGALYLLALLLAILVAPGVVTGLSGRQDWQVLVAERSRQGERLQALAAQLGKLDGRGEELRLKLVKVAHAYDLAIPAHLQEASPPALPESIYALAIARGSRLERELRARLAASATLLDEVGTFEAAQPEAVHTTPSLCPLTGANFVLMSPFGIRRNPFSKELEWHAGVDFAAPLGTPVRATADGDVTFVGTYPLERSVAWWRLGILVVVRNGPRFATLFGHLEDPRVRVGQRIRAGETIAAVGSTGWSVSPHVHYEVRRLDAAGQALPVDPLAFVLDHHWLDEERGVSGPRPGALTPLPPGLLGGWSGGNRQRRSRARQPAVPAPSDEGSPRSR